MASLSRRFPVAKVLLVLVILVSVNLLGMRFFHRWDLTENKEFTLSESTRQVLHRLDDVVNVKAYFSRELPSYFATLDRQVKDLLDEYEAHGDGRLTVEFVDPADDPALEQSLRMLGIPKLQFSQYQEERASVMNGYVGIAVQYEDRTEVIPVVQNVDRLEYDLTEAIFKASTARQTVGIGTAGSPTVPEGSRALEEILRRQYEVRVVDLEAGPVPPEVVTLVVVDEDALSETALHAVDQFVMRGGRILAFVPGVAVDLNTLSARDRQPRLGSQLMTYGIAVSRSLVVDAQAPMVSFDVGFFLPLSVRYPWFPQVTEAGLSRENPITADLQSLVLPWTSALQPVPVDSSAGASVELEILARSSERSYSRSAPYDLNPQTQLPPPPPNAAAEVLAVALTGRFPSHWRGAPAPGDTLGLTPPGPDVSVDTRMVVVGTANVADPRFLQQFAANAVFVANAVDWMTLGTELIAIRSRGAVSRPLEEVEPEKRVWFKVLAMVPVPVLVIVFGLVRARVRRRRREDVARKLGGAA